jgi:hypothetical protein
MPSLRIYPFVAAGVLVNSLYNLQASALYVVGQQWLVMRAYALHVVLLAAGTLVLLPGLELPDTDGPELRRAGDTYSCTRVEDDLLACRTGT